LKVEEPNWIRIEIRWRTITASDETDWPFSRNGKLGPVFQDEQRRGPQIYRFLFHDGASPSCYIGQSERVEDRARAYHRELRSLRNPVPSTQPIADRLEQAFKDLNSFSETRVGAAIQNAERDRIKIELQLLDFSDFAFNKVSISKSSLTNPFHRNVMENLAILDAEVSDIRVLNRGRDTEAKALSYFLKHGKWPKR